MTVAASPASDTARRGTAVPSHLHHPVSLSLSLSRTVRNSIMPRNEQPALVDRMGSRVRAIHRNQSVSHFHEYWMECATVGRPPLTQWFVCLPASPTLPSPWNQASETPPSPGSSTHPRNPELDANSTHKLVDLLDGWCITHRGHCNPELAHKLVLFCSPRGVKSSFKSEKKKKNSLMR